MLRWQGRLCQIAGRVVSKVPVMRCRIDGVVCFLWSCSPGSFHEKSERESFSDMTMLGRALIGFSSPLSLMGRRDVYLAESVGAADTVGR